MTTMAVPLAGSLSVAGDSLWIHNTNNGGSSVQIDPTSGAPGIKLDGTIGDVVFAGGLYWTIFSDDPADEQASTVIAVDPATGKTVVTLPAPRADEIAASPVGLWVSSAPGYLLGDSVKDPSEPATLGLINPATQAFVAGPVPMDNGGPGFAAGDGALWFADYESGNVTKVTFTPDAALPSG